MKRLLALAVLGAFGLAATPAFAADNPQQDKMKECQAQAGEKKLEGKDRQNYVNTCLKATPAKPESKMAMCNKQTAGLKGDERSKAQSECMKATPAKPESKMAMCNKKTAGLKGDERSKAQSECMKGG